MFRRVGIQKKKLRDPATAVKIYELLLDKISFSQSTTVAPAGTKLINGIQNRIDNQLDAS